MYVRFGGITIGRFFCFRFLAFARFFVDRLGRRCIQPRPSAAGKKGGVHSLVLIALYQAPDPCGGYLRRSHPDSGGQSGGSNANVPGPSPGWKASPHRFACVASRNALVHFPRKADRSSPERRRQRPPNPLVSTTEQRAALRVAPQSRDDFGSTQGTWPRLPPEPRTNL